MTVRLEVGDLKVHSPQGNECEYSDSGVDDAKLDELHGEHASIEIGHRLFDGLVRVRHGNDQATGQASFVWATGSM
jgi:hypothetical protein